MAIDGYSKTVLIEMEADDKDMKIDDIPERQLFEKMIWNLEKE